MRKRTLALAAMLASGCLGARAQTPPQATFEVSATIAPGCVVMGPANVTSGDAGLINMIDFGTAPALQEGTLTASAVMAGGITMRCTQDLSMQVSIDGGLHFGNGLRHVAAAGGARVPYRLKANAFAGSYLAPGEVFPAAITPGNAFDWVLPVVGVLDLPGSLPSGIYSDTLQVTLSW